MVINSKMSHPPSVVISRLLNDLGYSYEHIISRQKCFAAFASPFPSIAIFICGSKREGLTLFFENDFDCMAVFPPFECFETEEGSRNSTTSHLLLLAKSTNTAPGYALLKLISLQESDHEMGTKSCLVDIGGEQFLSSDKLKQQMIEIFTEEIRNKGMVTMSRDSQGPSCPMQFLGGLLTTDFVAAIPCDCPRLISAWRNRPRPYDWPSRELINDVPSLQAHAVPVGYKGSQMHSLEWRICFTLGEIRLIESLNECQIKLIILLKMIAQEELKPICQEMSSYVMKNIVLWLAESFPSAMFQERNLIKLLINSLKVLKQCIIKKKFPSYMIESRNLFADRIRDTEAIQLCKKIDTCLCEGPKMLLRCKKIRDGLAMFRTKPVVFYQLSEYRKLLLELFNEQLTLFCLRKCTAGADLLKELAFKMKDEPSTVDDIFDTIKDITCNLLDEDNLKSREVDINLIMRRLKYLLS